MGEAHLRRLAEQYLDTVEATDEAQDGLFGEGERGDRLPPAVRDRSGRGDRIDRALAQVKARRAGRAQAGAKPLPPDEHRRVRLARAAYEAALAQATHAEADSAVTTAAADRASEPATTDSAEVNTQARFTANLTDPDSRLLKTRNGWIQGYNCQTASSEDGFVVSARVTQDANDVEQFIPTMNDLTGTAEHLASRTGRDDLTIGIMIGDAGYDSDANLAADGPDRLIADGKRHTIDRRADANPATGDPPEHASVRDKMNHRLRTPDGHALYRRRAHLVEAPNAWLKDRRGLRRFSRRGQTAAHAEFAFASAVTNLLKISTKGITATQLSTC